MQNTPSLFLQFLPLILLITIGLIIYFLVRRKKSNPSVKATSPDASNQSEDCLSRANYFTVSFRRFILYELISAGLWSTYWFYRNWEAINKAGYKKELSPFARAWFHHLTAFSLFKKILQGAKKLEYTDTYKSSTLAALIIVFGMLGRALDKIEIQSPGMTIFVAVFSLFNVITTPLIMAPVIKTVQFIKSKNGMDLKADNKLTTGQYVFFGVGICIWVLALFGVFSS